MLLSLSSEQLLEGMVLAQDIVNDEGVLLLPSGRRLSDFDIFWISNLFKGREVLISEPRLYGRFATVAEEEIVKGVKNALLGIKDLELMYKTIRLLKDSISGYFTKLYPQLIDLKKTDPITFDHTINVGWFSLFVGTHMNVDENSLKDLLQAAVLHDIGKSFISVNLLTKPGKLTAHEFEIVKKHSVYGETWSRQFTSERVSKMIRNHHELIDGSGYPDGLSGSAIDIYTHIITVSDMFEAMISDRAYRRGMSPFVAYKVLVRDSLNGKLIHKVVSAFQDVLNCLSGCRIIVGGLPFTFVRVNSDSEVLISNRQGQKKVVDMDLVSLIKYHNNDVDGVEL